MRRETLAHPSDEGSIPSASTTEYAKPLIRQRLCRFRLSGLASHPKSAPQERTDMAIKLPSHLHRSRSGTLHFRIAIPPDLRHYFASREIYRSLRTPSVRDATHTAQALSIAFKRVFSEIRQRNMSDRYKAPKSAQTGSEFGLVVEFDFDEFMRPKNVKVKSEPDDAPDAMQSALATIIGAAQGARTGSRLLPQVPQATKYISEYVEPYLDGIPADHRPNEKTLQSYRAGINTFIKIVGDKPLHELSVKDQNRFEDVILKLPVTSQRWRPRADYRSTRFCYSTWTRSVFRTPRTSRDAQMSS
jgi:hypothetical protein